MALSQLELISVSRGDTKDIEITITSGTIGVNDKILFSVRENVEPNYKTLITKTLTSSDLSFTITHQDSLQKIGSYYYDFRLVREDGSVATLCAPSHFEIVGTITNV